MRISGSLAAGLLLALVGCGAARAPEPGLRRGINIADWSRWRDPDPRRFTRAQFRQVRRAGFDFVRIGMSAIGSAGPDGRIDPRWLATLDQAVDRASAAGLGVILDAHDHIFCRQNGATCRERLPAFWRELAAHYRDRPPNVLFELLNEPNGEMNPIWNDVIAETLAAIRATNPRRRVVIGPRGSNNQDFLPELRLPRGDPNILVTVHYYRPHPFTHQGAPWEPDLKSKTGIRWGAPAERVSLAADMAQVRIWAQASGRPVLVGEFGAYDRSDAPLAELRRYDGAVARAAERNGLAWCYWQFSGLTDFDANWRRDVAPLLPALTGRR